MKNVFLLKMEKIFGQPDIFLFNIDVGCFGERINYSSSFAVVQLPSHV